MPGKNYICSQIIFKGKELNLEEWEWRGMKQRTEKNAAGTAEKIWLSKSYPFLYKISKLVGRDSCVFSLTSCLHAPAHLEHKSKGLMQIPQTMNSTAHTKTMCFLQFSRQNSKDGLPETSKSHKKRAVDIKWLFKKKKKI